LPPPHTKGARSVAASHPAVGGYGALLHQLSGLPRVYSVFSFLDMVTLVWVWGELWRPPVCCGDVYPLSLYYYPLFMSVFELIKFNQYAASVLWLEGRPAAALAALLNISMVWSNLVVSLSLFVMFLLPSVCCGGSDGVDPLSWPAESKDAAELGGGGASFDCSDGGRESQATANPMRVSTAGGGGVGVDVRVDSTDSLNNGGLQLRPSQA